MNLTKACPSNNDKSCQVSCQDPSNSNQCVVLQSTLIDGSPCGYGGTCISGNCKPGTWWEFFKVCVHVTPVLLPELTSGEFVQSWYTHNLQISIPVTIVVAIIVILILWGITRCKSFMSPLLGLLRLNVWVCRHHAVMSLLKGTKTPTDFKLPRPAADELQPHRNGPPKQRHATLVRPECASPRRCRRRATASLLALAALATLPQRLCPLASAAATATATLQPHEWSEWRARPPAVRECPERAVDVERFEVLALERRTR